MDLKPEVLFYGTVFLSSGSVLISGIGFIFRPPAVGLHDRVQESTGSLYKSLSVAGTMFSRKNASGSKVESGKIIYLR